MKQKRTGTGARRRGRALAMKLLYQAVPGGQSLEDVLRDFNEYQKAPERVQHFALQLARGVLEHREDIDAKIKEALQRWEFDRLAAVDTQLMRVAIYELLFLDDIPANVTIDEAIELSRQYSTEQSSKFVNGVLGNLCAKYAAHKVEHTPKAGK